MINTIIVDDNPTDIDYLEKQIKQLSQDIKIVGRYTEVEQVKSSLPSLNVDLMFLDIELNNGLTAFDLLDNLPGEVPPVIFVTSYNGYAIEALRHNAIDYLLKPVDRVELDKAIQKVLNNKIGAGRIADFRADYHIAKFDLLEISETGAICYVPISDIIYIQAQGNYSEVLFINEQQEITSKLATKNLSNFEGKLMPKGFIRIHQSYLVNGRFIRKIYKSKNEVSIIKNITLPVARERKQEVIRMMKQ